MRTDGRIKNPAPPEDQARTGTGRELDGAGGWNTLYAAGTAVIAGLATVLAREETAYADCQGSPCCELASCNRCNPNRKPLGWDCPRGFFRLSWNCVFGRHHVICGECMSAPGTDCFAGPHYACSIWFQVD
jgi:hypothetical protein